MVYENATEIEICAGLKPPYGNVACPVDFDFDLQFTIDTATVSSGDIISGGDNFTKTIYQCGIKQCFTVPIVNDNVLEREERFIVNLEPLPGHEERIELVDIVKVVDIIDDDEIEIDITGKNVVVEGEDRNLTVCLTIMKPTVICPTHESFTLIVYTNDDGTAEAGLDFVDMNIIFEFEPCEKQVCHDIVIIDDLEVENNEEFTINVIRPIGVNLNLINSEKTIIIVDVDVIMIGFTQTVYEANGNLDSVMVVCAEVEEANGECLADFAFKVGFRTTGGSADEYEDYIPVTNANFTFERCDTMDCIIVELINDCILEETEEINLRLIELPGQYYDRVLIGGGDSTIEINNNNYISVGMEETSYITFESARKIEVCVEQNGCNSSELFVVELHTNDDSAGPDDYVALNSTHLVFAPYEEIVCTQFTIIDDVIVEQIESFAVTLSIYDDPSGRVVLGRSEAVIGIFDDDVAVIALELEDYDVSEDEGTVNVCVEPNIVCPVEFPFELILKTSPITAEANVDYITPNHTLRFGSCFRNDCFPIEIVNDNLIESRESFNVTLESSHGQSRYLIISEDSQVKQVNIIDNDLVEVGFTSSIYPVRESSGSVSVCAEVFTPDIRCPVDEAFNLTLLVIERTALFPDDFYAPVISKLEFEPCFRRACTSDIVIKEDAIVEEIETFALLLHTSQRDLIRINPKSAMIQISDPTDRAYVKFEKSLYEVTERVNYSVEVCAIITSPDILCPVDFIFELILSEGLNQLPIVFTSCSNRSCALVSIQDDHMVDGMTTIIMRLGGSTDLDSRIIVRTDVSTIQITDDPNDRALVGLERTNYVFPEDTANPEVCVVVLSPSIQCPINIEFSVMIETTDLTAASSSDYSPVRRLLRFDECDTRMCVGINFSNDLTTENTEGFRVTISGTSNIDPRIILVPDEAHVTITDADKAVINMASTSYTRREDVGMFEICMTVSSTTGRYTSCPVAFNFSVVLLTMNYSAVRGNDFVYFVKSVTFEACDRQACTEVEIIDNCELEDTEQFRVSLFRNGLDPDISIGDDSATTITITDDDEVNVGMEFTQYTASEDGGPVVLCAVVSCEIPFDFRIYLTTSGGTASADDIDYTSLTREELRFAAYQRKACVNVTPLDDAEVEGDETFDVSLSHDSDLDRRIRINPNRATVTIIDDDAVNVRLEYPAYLTSEDGPLSVEVCAIMISPVVTDCPVNSTIRVRMSTSDGTAVSAHDYTSVSTTLTFASCAVKSSCVNVYIRDDNIMEALREAFSISLDRGFDTRIRVSTFPPIISITDNDGLEIGLERTSHTVAENPGASVSVCTRVVGSNRVGIPVSLRLSTVRDTAVSPSDYTALMSTAVTFQPGNTSQCVTVSINDDDTVEDTESFAVTLTKPNGLDPRATLRDTSATITITDSDVNTLGFEMGTRTVNESAGTIQDAICLVINGGMSCSVFSGIVVTFTVTGSVNEEDYDGIPATKELGCGTTMCVPITILDDNMVENEENLIISLSTNSRMITIDQSSRSTEIIINDNDDAMVRLRTSYSLTQESRGREQVCVIVLDQKSVAFPFEVHFTFTEGTALTPEDYIVNDDSVTIAPGHFVTCVEVTLVDSPNLEMPQSFYVDMELVNVDSRITLATGGTHGEIEIYDDDIATVGLESTSYMYNTGDSAVEVCVYISLPIPPTPIRGRRDCPITFPIDLIFHLSPVTAAIFEVEEREYQPDGGIRKSTDSDQDVVLEFNSCQRRFCFLVKVKDGETPTPQTDPDEYMIRVARTPDHGRTTLLDDDKTVGRIVVN